MGHPHHLSGPAPGGAGDPHAGHAGRLRGGGSVPTQLLPTFAVALPADKLSPNQAEQALRCREKPIIGRITEGRLLLDVRTIFPEDMEYIADTAAEVLA